LEEELKMIDLNISSLVALNKLFVKDMVARKSGRIMNISSLMAFLPFPYYSVYSATKTFVLAFTETLASELEGTGVVVTALCPGPIDTGFYNEEMLQANMMKSNKPVKPEVVAKEGVKLLLHGKGKKIVGFMNWFLSNVPRVTPDFLMMKIKKNMAAKG
jgi:short-subunit dehydrogenase